MDDAEQGPRHRFAGIPSWISAGAAVVAALGGIAFGIANLGSSDAESSTTTTRSSEPAPRSPDDDGPTVSPPRIVTVRRDPPPIVSASGTAANLPSGARIYVGVRTVTPTDSGASQASGDETAVWELSTRGSSVDKLGTWKVEDFAIPESVDEPYEFFAIATTSGLVGAISNSEGSSGRTCRGMTEPIETRGLATRCEVAKSTTVPYRPQ